MTTLQIRMKFPTHTVIEWQVIIYSMLAIFFSGSLVFFAIHYEL